MERLRLYVNAIGKINFIYRIVSLPINIISQCETPENSFCWKCGIQCKLKIKWRQKGKMRKERKREWEGDKKKKKLWAQSFQGIKASVIVIYWLTIVNNTPLSKKKKKKIKKCTLLKCWVNLYKVLRRSWHIVNAFYGYYLKRFDNILA